MASEGTVEWMVADRAYAFLALALATCVTYDHITTLDEEIELVWKRPKWTVVQILFFINRYTGEAIQIYTAFVLVRHIGRNTEESCNLLITLIGYFGTAVACAMQGIMVYRVSAMYNHQRKIIILLAISFAIEFVGIVILQAIQNDIKTDIPDPAPGVHLCKQDNVPSWSYVNWLFFACFEALILVLSLSVGIKYYRSTQFNRRASKSSRNSLAYILFRDSITFPFINALICIVNFVIWRYPPYLAGQIAFTFAVFAPCIIGSRLILNLREAYYRPFVEECNVQLDQDQNDFHDFRTDVIDISRESQDDEP